MKSFRALTVFEALVILAILVILFMLLFPAVTVGPGNSEKTQAKNDATQIATAAMAFETEYGRLPGTNSGTVGGETLAALMGSNSLINPRNIVFIEINAAKKGKSGIRNGTFVDPWGGTYQIAYASGTNDWVIAGTNRIKVNKKVAVWTDPSLGREEWSWNPPKKSRRYVTSWD